MSIPKIIHYCWFGGKPLPPMAIKCIDSWKRYCPDYKIIQWDESNFDLRSNEYAMQSYEAKKYAFVSDYVRLYVLYNNGGIYMDTDVEVLKSLDLFLNNEAFSGFETSESVQTGIMGCIRECSFFYDILSIYSKRKFIKSNGTLDLTTNVQIITDYCMKHGLQLNNNLQTVNGFTLYPQEYFCPKNLKTNTINITNNTFTIHHFSGSWIPKKNKIKNRIIRLLGTKITTVIIRFKNVLKAYMKR